MTLVVTSGTTIRILTTGIGLIVIILTFVCFQVCAVSPRERVSESALALTYAEALGRPLPDVMAQPGLSYDEVFHDDFRFDLDAHDVMVFLHIQKTGGTSFGRHLVMDLDLKVSPLSDLNQIIRSFTKCCIHFISLYFDINHGNIICQLFLQDDAQSLVENTMWTMELEFKNTILYILYFYINKVT